MSHSSVSKELLSHVQCVLKFGTRILGMKAFLVDGVICVEPNHDGIPRRVDFFQGLQGRGTKQHRVVSLQLR